MAFEQLDELDQRVYPLGFIPVNAGKDPDVHRRVAAAWADELIPG